jgi:drug/metabolite transporter (DMT)-like permease
VSLLPLAGAFIFSVYIIMNRRLSSQDTPLTMQFVAGTTAALLTGVVLVAGGLLDIPSLQPTALGWREIGLLVLMGALGTVGHLLLVHAAQSVPSSLIAPFAYLEIVGATVLGYALFGDFPDFWKWIGIVIICASGVYVFWRERKVAQARRDTPVERIV